MLYAVAALLAAALTACTVPATDRASIDLDVAIPAVPNGIGGADLDALVAELEAGVGATVSSRDPLVLRADGAIITVRGDPVGSIALHLMTGRPDDLVRAVEPLVPYLARLSGAPRARLEEALARVALWDGGEDVVADDRRDGYRVFAWARGPVPTLILRIEGAD